MTPAIRHVSAIKDGTVIDHIPVEQGLRILALLRLAVHPKVATVGMNLFSKRLKRKDIIKLEDRLITSQEEDRIAILAPGATLVRIQNYQVVSKKILTLPSVITSLIVCPNHNCITNHEPMETRFHIHRAGKSVRIECVYCERMFIASDVKEYLQE